MAYHTFMKPKKPKTLPQRYSRVRKEGEQKVPKPRVGHPVRREFDKQTFEGLCHIWCTHEELEHILKTKLNILSGWCMRTYGEPFEAVYNQFSSGGKASLRRTQVQLSKKSTAMAIWLGKQKLEQREAPSAEKGFNGELKEYIDQLKEKNTLPE